MEIHVLIAISVASITAVAMIMTTGILTTIIMTRY